MPSVYLIPKLNYFLNGPESLRSFFYKVFVAGLRRSPTCRLGLGFHAKRSPPKKQSREARGQDGLTKHFRFLGLSKIPSNHRRESCEEKSLGASLPQCRKRALHYES